MGAGKEERLAAPAAGSERALTSRCLLQAQLDPRVDSDVFITTSPSDPRQEP